MDVPVIGAEDGLVSEEAADNREPGIQERNRECNQRCGHGQNCGGFLAPDYGITAQKKADKEAARVAKENGGRIKVEAQNGYESSSEGEGGNSQCNVVIEESGNQNGYGGQETDTGG